MDCLLFLRNNCHRSSLKSGLRLAIDLLVWRKSVLFLVPLELNLFLIAPRFEQLLHLLFAHSVEPLPFIAALVILPLGSHTLPSGRFSTGDFRLVLQGLELLILLLLLLQFSF